MKATREMFQIWENHFHEKLVDRNDVEYVMGIAPAAFCAMQYINDDRYLPGDEAPGLGRLRNVCNNNVGFCHTRCPDGPADFHSHLNLAIQASRNIGVGEELYCNHRNSNNFNTYLIKLHCAYE